MKCSLLALGAVALTTILALPNNPQARATDAPVAIAVAPPATTFKTSIIKTHAPATAATAIATREMDKGMLDKRENVRIATREMDKGMLDKRLDARMQMKKKIDGFFKSCHQKLGSAMKMNRPVYPHSEAALEDATGRVATINPRGVAEHAHPKEEKYESMSVKSTRRVPFFKGGPFYHDSKKEKDESMGMKSARRIPFFGGASLHHDSKKEKDESMGMKSARRIPFFGGATLRHDSKKEKDNGKAPAQ
jgi:hypothetical protein